MLQFFFKKKTVKIPIDKNQYLLFHKIKTTIAKLQKIE